MLRSASGILVLDPAMIAAKEPKPLTASTEVSGAVAEAADAEYGDDVL